MDVSIVVPVYNESRNLAALYDRLRRVMETQRKSYELIFVDDGSKDASLEILKAFAATDPHVKVVEFMRNFGQHAAVMAGLEQAQGEAVVTLDADLQNPPEEIPKLLVKLDEGYDTVGGWRQHRDDFFLRKMASFFLNKWSASLFGLELKDYGCMLRVYRRDVVQQIVKCNEASTYIPALANSFAKKVTEIPVEHAARTEGKSNYNLLKLLRLNFDLMTGFSLLPIQLVGLSGVLVALCGLVFAVFLFVRRLIVGPEAEGMFTLFAIMFIFVGLQLLALGIVGEYVGRIYREVRRRPRSVVRKIYSQDQK